MIGVCLKRILIVEIDIEGRKGLLEGLKGIVRELSFTGNPGLFGGSCCRFCGAVRNEERVNEVTNVLDW